MFACQYCWLDFCFTCSFADDTRSVRHRTKRGLYTLNQPLKKMWWTQPCAFKNLQTISHHFFLRCAPSSFLLGNHSALSAARCNGQAVFEGDSGDKVLQPCSSSEELCIHSLNRSYVQACMHTHTHRQTDSKSGVTRLCWHSGGRSKRN